MGDLEDFGVTLSDMCNVPTNESDITFPPASSVENYAEI